MKTDKLAKDGQVGEVQEVGKATHPKMIQNFKDYIILQVFCQERQTSSKSPMEVKDSWQSYNHAIIL